MYILFWLYLKFMYIVFLFYMYMHIFIFMSSIERWWLPERRRGVKKISKKHFKIIFYKKKHIIYFVCYIFKSFNYSCSQYFLLFLYLYFNRKLYHSQEKVCTIYMQIHILIFCYVCCMRLLIEKDDFSLFIIYVLIILIILLSNVKSIYIF